MNKLKPDKDVKVPPYVYLTEGYNPDECDKLNSHNESDCRKRYSTMLSKETVLDILKQPIQNLDLSWEYCDERFIEKIKKL